MTLVISTVSCVKRVEILLSSTCAVHSPDWTFSQNPPSLKRLHISSDVTRLIIGILGVELSLMITVAQIREHLLDLLVSDDAEALDGFEDWLSSASWNMHQHADLQAQKFISAIELRLAEFDSGLVEKETLRKQLNGLLREYSISISQAPIAVSSASSVDFKLQVWAVSSSGMSPSMASVLPVPR